MEKYSEEIPFLVAQTGPLNGQRYAIRRNTIMGREADCDIVIADRQVSRHHARLTFGSEGVLLEDLESKNGTHHNGQAVTHRVCLQDGDVIQIALAQRFVFLSSDSTIPLENQSGELSDLQGDNLTGGLPELEPGRLRLEKKSRRVWIKVVSHDGSPIDKEILPPLSVSQFRLLEILYDNPGRVVTRPQLITAVWGEGQTFEISEQALDALVRRLRDRIAQIDPSSEFVVTVRGHGLRLENPAFDL